MEWGYKWRTWYTKLYQSRRSPHSAFINFGKSKPSQSTSTFEQPTCGSERRPLCQRRWIPNTPKLAAASNAEGSNRNKKRLTAWLQINLEGTFTRKIPWLWIGQWTTRTAGREISGGKPNARSQHGRTSVLPEDLLRQRRPRTTSPSRTRTPIKIKPGGTQDVSPTQEEINFP